MKEENKIPKIIHYCWFGGAPLSEMAKKCIKSWEKYCPDYQIMEWNEQNFDVNFNDYVKEAYLKKKWAFVSDVARLYALVNYGGIYMDTDVEVIKSLDDLLKYESFAGFETETQIQTGLLACCKKNELFYEFLNDYNDMHFLRNDGSMDLTTNVTRITNICNKYGLILNNSIQCVKGMVILPKEYLCPKDHETKKINITKNTYVVHHFDGSWHSDEELFANKLSGKFKFRGGSYLAKLVGIIKYRGIVVAFREGYGWIKRK